MAEQPVARGRDAAVLAAGLALLFVLGLSSLRTKSAIYDEPVHFTAGYAAARFGEVRFNPDHPPLVGLLATAPLLFTDVHFPADDPAWGMGRPYEVGRRFLYRWNDGDRLLIRGRTVILGLAAALAALVFFWARATWGAAAAALALLLAVTSPDVLAHGQVVTTDIGAALFIFATVVAFQRVTERVTAARVLAAGLALGAAFATKFSAVILLPVLVALAVVVALRGEALPVRATARTRTRDKLLVLAGVLAVMGAIAFLVLWSVYRFRYAASADPRIEAAIPWDRLRPEEPVGSLVDGLRRTRLLPEGYLWGFVRFFEHQESRPSFLLGQRSDRGFAAFFPVSFAVKTPLGLLGLLAVSAVLAARGLRRREDLFLWVPVLFYAAVSLTRGINIGHRHLLPLYPFLFVFAGRAGLWAARVWPRRGPAALVAALAAWHVGAALWIHPHHLAYFNELAGGPSNGYRVLVDSSLDWGQDLKGLKPYMQAHGIPRVKLSYFGTADPAYYGIEADLLPGYLALPRETVRAFRPGDVLAVSATNLAGVYLDPADRPMMDRLRREQPVDSVGYSILIFRPSFAWPEPPGAR